MRAWGSGSEVEVEVEVGGGQPWELAGSKGFSSSAQSCSGTPARHTMRVEAQIRTSADHHCPAGMLSSENDEPQGPGCRGFGREGPACRTRLARPRSAQVNGPARACKRSFLLASHTATSLESTPPSCSAARLARSQQQRSRSPRCCSRPSLLSRASRAPGAPWERLSCVALL
ncbi:hypothetical protein BU26DRAFT_189274 [Trematosphaeria pertusa]|uniref:Uncharacterized protein n=1 Tax=Trematosphaeria pertusa TaxID=390896 RepID=A0A6A6HRH9_9PLEO|nr:uncharacterized protein BU26DRAFT_189274 [Trematosphaeria pertusa]KAF2240764.1 hypothetical protein BU26DRAFT_189274 [Trematosphaeria pertusa]